MSFSGATVVLAASTGATSSGGGGSALGLLVPLVLFGLLGYFLLIRPARTRQRRMLESRAGVDVGVEVITTAGLFATVIAVNDDEVTLEIAPGVQSRFLKGAIARVNTPPAEAETPEPEATPDPTDTTEH